MRLDKFICKSTELTRDEALASIHGAEICVNGVQQTCEALQVHEKNTITRLGQRLTARPFRYYAIYKSAGTVCSNVDEHYPSVFTGLGLERSSELHCVGRLDADTTGLILATDDGRWSYHITRPESHCAKVYRVQLKKALSEETMVLLEAGLLLQGETKTTLPAVVNRISATEVLLTLTEGKFHQVKRMFACVGNKVHSLHRLSIGSISLDLNPSEYRALKLDEVDSLAERTLS